MVVYVDDMRKPVRLNFRVANWSHLIADTHNELETFARLLGLKPAWIQYPGTWKEHYDVTDTVRKQALLLGAQPVKYGREFIMILKNKTVI